MNTLPASRSHDAVIIELLRTDPEFSREYLAAAQDEASEPGGHAAWLAAFRQVAAAQIADAEDRAYGPRKSL